MCVCFPTTNCATQDGSSVGMHTCCAHVFASLAPISMLSRCFVTKFLHRSSGGSLLRVRCWLGWATKYPTTAPDHKKAGDQRLRLGPGRLGVQPGDEGPRQLQQPRGEVFLPKFSLTPSTSNKECQGSLKTLFNLLCPLFQGHFCLVGNFVTSGHFKICSTSC